jgi:peptide/nickel transport system permease protein
MSNLSADRFVESTAPSRSGLAQFVRRNPTIFAGGAMMLMVVALAILAPLVAGYNPLDIAPGQRMQPPSFAHYFGTDALGRDVFARTLWGGRISLLVAVGVASLSTTIGLALGLVSGFFRALDAIIMRVMDGLMAIPAILIAIAIATVSRASIATVVVAITIPEIPRVVRLVRSLVLSIREQPYIEAAISLGTRRGRILTRHVLPNVLTPLTVQATFVCASAVIVEAYLSFLGAGTPPEIPSWGNIMAEGRRVIQLGSWVLLYPGLFLGATVLSINLVGDGLRELLDPRIASRM